MDNNTAQNSSVQYPNLTVDTSSLVGNSDLNAVPPSTSSVQDQSEEILQDLSSQVQHLSDDSASLTPQEPSSPLLSEEAQVSPTQEQIPEYKDVAAEELISNVEDVAREKIDTSPADLSNIQEASPIIDTDRPIPETELQGVVPNELQDIIPGEKVPRALKRDPKEKNLSMPPTDSDTGELALHPPQTEELKSSVLTKKIDELLKFAVQYNASDLHITVGYPPIVRIDGELREISESIITEKDAEDLILPILSDEKRELLEVNKEIDVAYSHEGEYSSRFRINIFYTMKALSGAFRLIPTKIRTIEELMLPKIYHRFSQLKQGFILITGPTGHGKSTTLAAILDEINSTRFTHIVTIEDPIEYVFKGKKSLVDQREMNEDTHSWPIALRSAFRQDPDVILVGEMRDYETIASAITLAETGHLVFATLHTNNAAQTVDRIIDVFPHNQQAQIRLQLSNILEAIVAQRLIPLDKGGRRAVTEIMIANPAVRNLIREAKTHQLDNVIRTSADIGMVSLERSLVSLVREGVISVSKAQEYAVFPEEVLRLLKS
jgi:twitching motility protein PilT